MLTKVLAPFEDDRAGFSQTRYITGICNMEVQM